MAWTAGSMNDDNSPQLGGQEYKTGVEPELSGARTSKWVLVSRKGRVLDGKTGCPHLYNSLLDAQAQCPYVGRWEQRSQQWVLLSTISEFNWVESEDGEWRRIPNPNAGQEVPMMYARLATRAEVRAAAGQVFRIRTDLYTDGREVKLPTQWRLRP